MSLVLTQEQELLQGTIRDFSRDELHPIASKIDSDSKVPEELMRKLPELGLYGIVTSAEYGGAGADYASQLLTVEELSKVSGTVGAMISFHGIVCALLNDSTNEDLRGSILPKLAAGTLAAFSVDPKSSTSFRKSGEDYVLDGSSEYILNAGSAGVFLVLARSKEGANIIVCFLKEDVRNSVVIGEPKKLMGMRGSGTCSVSLKELKVSRKSIAFDSLQAGAALEKLLILSRLGVAAQALGIGEASLDEEVKYANERSQFNTKIGQFYAVQDFIASDEVSIDAARSVTYGVASHPLSEKFAWRKSCIAKIAASNAAVQAARHSIRIHGGYGFIRDYPVERYLRDARATQIYLESNEALKAKIAEDMLARPTS